MQKNKQETTNKIQAIQCASSETIDVSIYVMPS